MSFLNGVISQLARSMSCVECISGPWGAGLESVRICGTTPTCFVLAVLTHFLEELNTTQRVYIYINMQLVLYIYYN